VSTRRQKTFVITPIRLPPMDRHEGIFRWTSWTSWRLLQGVSVVMAAILVYRLFGFDHHPMYRLDIDVYRIGGRMWLNGTRLYGFTGSISVVTEDNQHLAFTYPPFAAIVFSCFALVSLPAASALITAISLVLLPIAIYLVLNALDVLPTWSVTRESVAARRAWLALIIAAYASFHLEPIESNYGYGQINVVIMTMVLADCLPKRTILPRGALVGLAIAVKLTPAVFILYFLVKRDWRAVRTMVVSFGAATAVAFVLAWRDSIDYWTGVVGKTGSRIADLRLNTNQNILSFLARLPLPDSARGTVWLLVDVLILALVVWAIRQAVTAGYDILGVSCAALFGLLTSPISWSHHWVWIVPILIATAVIGYRERNVFLLAISGAGVAITEWPHIETLPSGHESSAPWWSQLAGTSYVWWALTVITVIGLTVGPGFSNCRRSGGF
jgi:alpha-1,2-mannosyltransferase